MCQLESPKRSYDRGKGVGNDVALGPVAFSARHALKFKSMPGPSNKKKKQKGKGNEKSSRSAVNEVVGQSLASPIPRTVEAAMLEPPFIHDPGNGPRVRDVKMFMMSSFAQPVAQDDALCQEFGQKEVLEMLMTILPEETALILWYNKSRTRSRICPACLRLYNIGDELRDLLSGEDTPKDEAVLSRQLREQELSGFCSTVCFIIASVDFEGAITSAWGHTGDEMSEESWGLLNCVVVGGDDLRRALGMAVKMTRLHDLGLLELCFE